MGPDPLETTPQPPGWVQVQVPCCALQHLSPCTSPSGLLALLQLHQFPEKKQENAFLGTAPPLPVSLEMLLRKTSPHHLVLGPEWEQTLNYTAGAGAELHPVRRAAR